MVQMWSVRLERCLYVQAHPPLRPKDTSVDARRMFTHTTYILVSALRHRYHRRGADTDNIRAFSTKLYDRVLGSWDVFDNVFSCSGHTCAVYFDGEA